MNWKGDERTHKTLRKPWWERASGSLMHGSIKIWVAKNKIVIRCLLTDVRLAETSSHGFTRKNEWSQLPHRILCQGDMMYTGVQLENEGFSHDAESPSQTNRGIGARDARS